jgi:hypothetical protein
MTKNMKKITFYLDEDTQAILEKIPRFFRSPIIRDVIKNADSEGRIDTLVHNAISIYGDKTNTPTTPTLGPQPDEEPPMAAPPMPKSDCQSFKHLKRTPPIPATRHYPPPRASRSFETPRNLRRMGNRIMVLSKYPDPIRQQKEEGPKSLHELPMCEVLCERPHTDRQTCASCIVRPCPH